MTRSSATYVTQAAAGDLAGYKAMFQPVSTAMQAVLPRTGATGQVNWSTISSVVSTARDYEVFALNDTLAATKPIYIRVNYTGYVSTTYPTVTLSVGTTSDAAGVIGGTGAILSLPIWTAPQSTGVTRWVYTQSDKSQFICLMGLVNPQLQNTNNTTPTESIFGWALERTRDLDGTPNGNGYMLWQWTSTAETTIGVWPFTKLFLRTYDGSLQQGIYEPPIIYPLGTQIYNKTQFSGNTLNAVPSYTFAGDATGLGGASRAVAFCHTTDFPRLTPVPLTLGGTAYQFMSLGSVNQVTVPVMSSATSTNTYTLTPMVRWE